MTDTATAIAADAPISAREAAGMLSFDPEQQESEGVETEHEEPATAAPEGEADEGAAHEESSDELDAAVADDDQQPPGETEQDDPADAQPSIDPPRSWSDEDKEAFKALPHDVQQRIAERERAREREIRQRQDEAAEQRKAAEAQLSAAEQARQHYEQQLPHLLQTMHNQFQQEFSDVQSWDDVQKMAQDDPVRYLRWDAMRKQGEAVQREAQAAQVRQQKQQQEWFQNFRAEEAMKFVEKAPEFADPEKAPRLQQQAFETLQDIGWSQQEIQAAWNEGAQISVHDHRFQLLVRDAMKYRNAQKATKTAKPKTVPPVQRPGPATGKNEAKASELQALERKLESTGKARDAAALLVARARA